MRTLITIVFILFIITSCKNENAEKIHLLENKLDSIIHLDENLFAPSKKNNATNVDDKLFNYSIENIVTSVGNFPYITLDNPVEENKLNNYIQKTLFDKVYPKHEIKLLLENEGYDEDNYANYELIEYEINDDDKKISLNVTLCTLGVRVFCSEYLITYNFKTKKISHETL